MKSSRNIAVSIVVVISHRSSDVWLNGPVIQRRMFLRIKNHGKPNFAAASPRTPDGKPDLLGIWEFCGGGHGGAGGRGVGLPSASLAACATPN